ncbi:M28 family peptidase [uncultured Algimonas sp.]|uniref:M28 family peptidase n=1 Tax=uncultured Algimonas sp. TaxID=1547920 RepID=UPI002620047F|nr:M28 family peptidase [uncultured Algimonas sp.]
MKQLLLASALFLAACSSGQTMTKEASTADLALATEVMRALSADDMEGRLWGTQANARARAYIAAQAAALNGGLMPEEQAFTRTVTRDGETFEVTGTNLITTLPGREPGGPVLEVMAHFDHIGMTEDGEIYNGADDNASGVGALLAILKDFTQDPPEHDINVVWLDTEEFGLAGAYEYVAARVDDRPRVAMNLDMIAQNEDGQIYMSGSHHTPALRPVVEAAADGIPLRLTFGNDRPEDGPDDWSMASDHAAFHTVGIPFVYLGVADHAHYHKTTDTFETIPLDTYHAAVQLAVNTARALDENLDALARPKAETVP